MSESWNALHKAAKTQSYQEADYAGIILMSGESSDRRILYANKDAERITGVSVSDLGAYSAQRLWADVFQLADTDQLQSVLAGQLFSGSVEVHHNSGTKSTCAIRVEPIRDAAGDVTHTIWTIHPARTDVSAGSNAVDFCVSLVGEIAHDFNNIISVTRSFANLIAETMPSGSRQHSYALRIMTASDRAATFVRQILMLTTGREAPREIVYIPDAINEVEALVYGRLPESATLSVTHETQNVSVLANASQMTQVLLNLVINASDAMTDGRGRLEISTSVHAASHQEMFAQGLVVEGENARYATDALKPETVYVKISVSDNGSGIPADILVRIFEPFFSTKDKDKGTGLGLAIVSSIVAAHGGVIVAQSRVGQGSIFSVYLPRHNFQAPDDNFLAHIARDHPIKHEVQSVPGHGRVMIVDDEPDVGDGLSFLLDRLGYETTVVYSPIDALERFRATPYHWDVVITDQNMPRMKGLDLIHALKQLNPDLKTILCSGSGVEPREWRTPLGADGFLIKPIRHDTLAAMIREFTMSAVTR